MEIDSRTILIPLIIGLIANLLSSYLFYLNIINLNLLIFIIVASVFVVIIIITQTGSYEVERRLNAQEQEQKRQNEKLKIHEQLIDMKAEIKGLQKRFEK